MVKRIVLLTATAILALILAGCGGASGGAGSTTKDAVVDTVAVKESEFKLNPSSITLKKPGAYVFKVENVGSFGHSLEIEGNGVQAETKVLDAGKSEEIKVDLKPGAYEMYCPVDGHKDKGMKGKVTVAGKNDAGDSGGGGSGGPGGGY